MRLLHLTAATARFAAARQVGLLPPGHPCARLHGHNFEATVLAELPPPWAQYRGAQVAALTRRLQECLHPLHLSSLNDHVEAPTDLGLARWIAARLQAPGVARIAVRSTPQQGVQVDGHGAPSVWRSYGFQAAHRLPRVPAGHKCGRMHGHGFEVMLAMAAAPHPEHAWAEFDRLDEAWRPWGERLDLSCLNDIEGLDNPTSELLASWLWQRLKPDLPALERVAVFETGSCGASFDGFEYRIWKDFDLDSAVRLRRAPPGSRAGGVHGHTFRLRLHLRAPLDAVCGWTMDFGDVKEIFAPVFEALDHRPLHEIAGLEDADTGSLAAWIFATTTWRLPALSAVELHETPGCGAVVLAQERGAPLGF
jgi:6-pyruvoyltetrahydropterin/6-carboxytetrahydropterin synthase